MDLHALKNERWTNKEISAELGFHPGYDPQVARGGRPAQEGRGG